MVSLHLIEFLHGIFHHKFIQLPFEPIYNFVSTTSCGRTFHCLTALSEVPLCICCELPGSCWGKKREDKKLAPLYHLYLLFPHATMICDFFSRPPSTFPPVWRVLMYIIIPRGFCSVPPALHPAVLFCILVKLDCMSYCHIQMLLLNRLKGFQSTKNTEACLKVEKSFLWKKHIENN